LFVFEYISYSLYHYQYSVFNFATRGNEFISLMDYFTIPTYRMQICICFCLSLFVGWGEMWLLVLYILVE